MQPNSSPVPAAPTPAADRGLSSITHPIKEIVMPLLTILLFVANAIGWGVTWGKVTTRVDVTEKLYIEANNKNLSQDLAIQSLKDRTHDLERDAKEDRKRFLLFDDYTRGRIQDLPYKPPPPAFWQSDFDYGDNGGNTRSRPAPSAPNPKSAPSHERLSNFSQMGLDID